MNKSISTLAVGHASSALLAIVFSLCVIFDLLFPGYAMYRSWQVLLPGFEWLSIGSFAIGLIESYAYGWLFAVIWTPIYNRAAATASSHDCCQHDHHSDLQAH